MKTLNPSVLLLCCATASGVAVGQPVAAPTGPKLVNAATAAYGVRVNISAAPGVFVNGGISPDVLTDGNAHSRLVVTGAPYTITINLPQKTHIEKVSFAQSDYGKEAAPKDIELLFDDGQKVTKTLEPTRPQMVNRRPQIQWQDVPIGRDIKSVQISVLSNYEGEVKWGGLGEVALWTSRNLDEQFKIQGFDADAPVFVHATGATASTAPVKVTLPPVAKEGEHPRFLFTPDELKGFNTELLASEKGRATREGLLKMADAYAGMRVAFPSVADTVANKADKAHGALSNRVGALGMAYGLTGDVKYATAAREILLGYAQRYEAYPRHAGRNAQDSSKVFFQRLSEAMWLIPQLEGYDAIYNSGALSDEDKKQIETGLIRPAILEIRRVAPADEVARRTQKDANWRTATPAPATQGNYANWLNFFSGATLMAGVVMGDKDMFDLAIADFKTAIATGIGADGMWGEGSIGYQLFAMEVMSPALETAAHNGVDLWSFSGGRFKQLFDTPLRYAYPDGTLPGINDSARGTLGSWQTMVYDYGYLRYGDPAYAALVNESPRQLHTSEGIYQPTRIYSPLQAPKSAVIGSTLFASLGYAIMRDDSKYALMDYGPHGGVHGHYDKLNLLLFANAPGQTGDEMGGEPQFHRYEDPLHGEWTTQTVAHNTMSVDGASQIANEGKLLVYEAAPGIQVMRAESDKSYAGVLLDRTVIVTSDAVLDLFSGRSEMEHTWDRTLRFSGVLSGLPALVAADKPLGERDGFQHIKVASTQEGATNWQGVWDTKAGKWSATVAGTPNQQVVLGHGPDDDSMALAQQTGKNADFAVAYGLDGWNNTVQNVKWLSKVGEGIQGVEMQQKDGTVTRVYVAHAAGEWTLGGWKSDARVLVVQHKGDTMQMSLCGGTFATDGKTTFRQPVAGNYRAQSKAGHLETISQWTP